MSTLQQLRHKLESNKRLEELAANYGNQPVVQQAVQPAGSSGNNNVSQQEEQVTSSNAIHTTTTTEVEFIPIDEENDTHISEQLKRIQVASEITVEKVNEVLYEMRYYLVARTLLHSEQLVYLTALRNTFVQLKIQAVQQRI